MGENRSTQFQGFAKALWEEIEQAIRQDPGFIPEGDAMRREYIALWQKIIARRAYDLVVHTLNNIQEGHVKWVPDLLELPKEQE